MTKISGEFHFHRKTPQQTQGRLCLIQFRVSHGWNSQLNNLQFGSPWQCPRCPGPHPSTLPRLTKWSAQCIHMDSHRRKMQHKGYSSFPFNDTKMHKEASWLPCSSNFSHCTTDFLNDHDIGCRQSIVIHNVYQGFLQYPFLANSCHQQTHKKSVKVDLGNCFSPISEALTSYGSMSLNLNLSMNLSMNVFQSHTAFWISMSHLQGSHDSDPRWIWNAINAIDLRPHRRLTWLYR